MIDWYRGVLLKCRVCYLKNLHGWGIYSENGEWRNAEYKKMTFGDGLIIPRLSEQVLLIGTPTTRTPQFPISARYLIPKYFPSFSPQILFLLPANLRHSTIVYFVCHIKYFPHGVRVQRDQANYLAG